MAVPDARRAPSKREAAWFHRTRIAALGFAALVLGVAGLAIVVSQGSGPEGRVVWYTFSLFPLAVLLGMNAVATFYERNTMQHGGRAVLHDETDR